MVHDNNEIRSGCEYIDDDPGIMLGFAGIID